MISCWCPEGSFTMGSPASEPERDSREGPVTVKLSGFWLAKYEFTQGQWEALGPGAGKPAVQGKKTDRLPKDGVSWNEATEACGKFTEQERKAGRLPAGWEYRLPTEAQWEYACRAGTKTATAFGDKLDSTQANFNGNYPYNGAAKGPNLQRTTEVGSCAANAWGLHDMHGNVWEWCRDWYRDELPGGTDPEVTSDAAHRVLRGGSWLSSGRYCGSAYRYGYDPDERGERNGFRVAVVRSG
ncbi:MAG: formylglycine-generating enzyme family protein [Planctomycetota bacterium]|nr:formylglycine-generating enzyme family protein [Planctomycetota bacterium]